MTKPREWISTIIPAAGMSLRLPGKPRKPFLKMLWHTLKAFANLADISEFIVALHADDLHKFEKSQFQSLLKGKTLKTVKGGRSRSASVQAALRVLDARATLVAIHDAARPLVAKSLIRQVIDTARARGAAIAAVPVTDTIKAVDRRLRITQTVPRENLWLAQTPQVFRKKIILEAYRQAASPATDDASLVENLGYPVYVVRSSPANLKVTTEEDLLLPGALLKGKR